MLQKDTKGLKTTEPLQRDCNTGPTSACFILFYADCVVIFFSRVRYEDVFLSAVTIISLYILPLQQDRASPRDWRHRRHHQETATDDECVRFFSSLCRLCCVVIFFRAYLHVPITNTFFLGNIDLRAFFDRHGPSTTKRPTISRHGRRSAQQHADNAERIAPGPRDCSNEWEEYNIFFYFQHLYHYLFIYCIVLYVFIVYFHCIILFCLLCCVFPLFTCTRMRWLTLLSHVTDVGATTKRLQHRTN